MKLASLGLLLAAFFWFQPSCFAQYQVFKSKEGVVFVSKRPKQYFTLDLVGKKIEPVGADSAPNPYFMVDGRFLQIVVAPFDAFQANPSEGQIGILKRYARSEAAYHKVPVESIRVETRKLPAGGELLIWSFLPPQIKKRQVFVCRCADGYVLALGSAFDFGEKRETFVDFLVRTAATFQAADQPIGLKFLPDGRYERVPSIPDSQLVGRWSYVDGTLAGDYTFYGDGVFTGSVTAGMRVVSRFTGRWQINGSDLLYEYLSDEFNAMTPGSKDRDKILEITKDHYIIETRDGSRHKYVRVN